MKVQGQKNKVKKPALLPARYIKYAKYKWELLRRNKKYINEWSKLDKVLKKTYGAWRPPDGSPTPEEAAFSKKWRITDPIPPFNSFDDFIQPLEGSPYKIAMQGIMFSRLFPETYHKRPITIPDQWKLEDGHFINQAKNRVAQSGNLTIAIDLSCSKKKLMDDFKILLNEWKDIYKPVSKKQKTPHTTYHFDNFDVYLQVYDLRKKRKSWSTIQKALGLNSIQTARNHNQSALKIIDEGIDLYVK